MAVMIDLTDTRFDGKSMDGEYRRGKDEKVKKLVKMDLVVTEKGWFPLFHRTFGGNISDKRIFIRRNGQGVLIEKEHRGCPCNEDAYDIRSHKGHGDEENNAGNGQAWHMQQTEQGLP
jgi:hypothetical protein